MCHLVTTTRIFEYRFLLYIYGGYGHTHVSVTVSNVSLRITNCRITLESMDPNHGHETKSKTLPCNTHQKKGSLYFIDWCSCLVVSRATYHLQVVYGKSHNFLTSLIDNKNNHFQLLNCERVS